jgi:hypothetical protein
MNTPERVLTLRELNRATLARRISTPLLKDDPEI